MYDKYSYEVVLMVFYDCDVYCIMVCGIVGFFVVVDLLFVIKYVKVKLICGDIKDKDGNVVVLNVVLDFEIEGEYL